MVDVSSCPGRTHEEIAEALATEGVRVLQLRMKGAGDSLVLAVAARILPCIRAAGATLVLNDRADLAATLPGVGVHLGQDDEDPRAVRRRLGPDRLIGWSTSDLRQARSAVAMGVDYVGFGPVFSAAGKHLDPADTRTPHPPVGLSGLRAAVLAAGLPVVAIGGIDLQRLDAVLATGVQAVAMVSAVTTAKDPGAAARAVQAAFARREQER